MRNLIFIFFTVIFLFISLFFGAANITISNIFDFSSMDAKIFWELRIPRTFLAFFTGAALALAGILFQTVFRNPLTTPFTLGVSSGATLGVAISIKFGLVASIFGISSYFLFGFFGAAATIAVLFIFANKIKSFSKDSLLLLGIALSFFYTSAIYIIFYLSSFEQTHSIVRFTLGSLSIVGINELAPVVAASLLLLFMAIYFSYELKILSISSESAHLKGVNIKKINLIILFFVSLAVGVVVSVTGPIGFIGLVIPHIVRKIYKQSIEKLLTPVFFIGGGFLLLCDMLSRIITMPSEIPIGVITSLIGAPFFIYLILTRDRG